MSGQPRLGRAVVSIVALLAVGLAGCGGSPPDLGSIEMREPLPEAPGSWRVVTIEGMTSGTSPVEALAVEAAADGTELTAFFQGGDPACYAVTDVDVVRRDPQVPTVTVHHGLRLGVMGCNAALYNLAIFVRLDPPFADG